LVQNRAGLQIRKVGYFEGIMHGSIRERLEELLADGDAAAGLRGQQHLSECKQCSSELSLMRAQAQMLSALRAPGEMEPSAGFYARVLQRIEEGGIESIWSVFRYSPFGKRLIYASLSLALLVGTYVVSEEARDGHLGGGSSVAANLPYDSPAAEDVPVFGNQAEQRDAVLVKFVSQRGTLQ
jgi:hypothetical protein